MCKNAASTTAASVNMEALTAESPRAVVADARAPSPSSTPKQQQQQQQQRVLRGTHSARRKSPSTERGVGPALTKASGSTAKPKGKAVGVGPNRPSQSSSSNSTALARNTRSTARSNSTAATTRSFSSRKQVSTAAKATVKNALTPTTSAVAAATGATTTKHCKSSRRTASNTGASTKKAAKSAKTATRTGRKPAKMAVAKEPAAATATSAKHPVNFIKQNQNVPAPTSLSAVVNGEDVVVFSASWCGFCSRAVTALKDAGYRPHVIDVDSISSALRANLRAAVGRTSVPQVFVRGKHVGGCNDGGLGGTMKCLRNGTIKRVMADHTSKQGVEGARPSPKWTGKVWQVDSKDLKMAIDSAVVTAHRTPLILDNTTNKLVRTFLKYGSYVPINMKAMVMGVALKQKTTDEAREEMRKQLVTAMTCGYPLHIDLMNSAPDFDGKFFSEDNFPRATLVTQAMKGFDGKTPDGEIYTTTVNTQVMHTKLATELELNELKHAEVTGRHSNMHPLITSDFDVEDYEEFLGPCMPDLDKFQVICVTNKQGTS